MLIAVAKYSELLACFLYKKKQYIPRIQTHKCSSPLQGKGKKEAENPESPVSFFSVLYS